MTKEWKISKITLPESIKLKPWPNRRKLQGYENFKQNSALGKFKQSGKGQTV
jgi:hypothetical protein